MIEIRHLKKNFGNLTVLKDVNAVIRKGEIISIIGPSGTGKSTLLRCLNLLEYPDAGEILVNGVPLLAPNTDIPAIRRKMGMVFQHFNLFPHLTVLENITIAPRKLLQRSAAEAKKKALELLKTVGLESKAFALPSELSGGQQQRIAIARALAMEPEIILFDEPTSALDPTMVDEVLSVISELAKTGITMIIVTHEMRFARNVSSRVFFMEEGRVYEEGTPQQIFESPKRPKTIAFIKRIDMEYFALAREDFDEVHIRSRTRALADRHHLSEEQREKFRGVFISTLRDVVFPVTEKIDLYMGVSKTNGMLGFAAIWDGKTADPFARVPEVTRYILENSRSATFSYTEDGRPEVKVLFDRQS